MFHHLNIYQLIWVKENLIKFKKTVAFFSIYRKLDPISRYQDDLRNRKEGKKSKYQLCIFESKKALSNGRYKVCFELILKRESGYFIFNFSPWILHFPFPSSLPLFYSSTSQEAVYMLYSFVPLPFMKTDLWNLWKSIMERSKQKWWEGI